ncbi:hypothetical protein ACG1BZ_14750 [Microbulbifer sp. CNSA002]|uniref:hypothetical protein n=1 Tax=unclassified Microbulbifer TaxID=2619833 RepID=UPI0039B37291
MNRDPGEVLSKARKAYQDEDYPAALENYQWFYHNALDVDEAYYGVRLSYCLGEWADLGREFPEAADALLQLKKVTLSDFSSTKSREAFHEYSRICEYLECKEEVYDQFLAVYGSDRELAEKLFPYVYEYCASNEKWDICREYLGTGNSQYKQSLEMFDQMMEFVEENSGEVGESLYRDAAAIIKQEALWILNMLNHINAPGEYESAISKMESDFKKRGRGSIYEQICEVAPHNQRQSTL